MPFFRSILHSTTSSGNNGCEKLISFYLYAKRLDEADASKDIEKKKETHHWNKMGI